MTRTAFAAAISAALLASPSHGQAAPSSEAVAAELAEMRARVARLEAELAALKAAQESKMGESGTARAESKPAKPEGVTVKPFGRLQYDVAHVGSAPGMADPGLGFGSELRRARLGVEGTIPGGFGYKLEVDFADNAVEVTDAFLSYRASRAFALTLGQHNNFQSLEELTSSRYLSFMERAAFTDAFDFERRVGLSATYSSGDVIAQAGLFTDNIEDLSDARDSVGADARLVFAPELGASRLHLGASAHWRDNGGAAAAGPATRYRQRPFVHTSDTRFLSTPGLRVETEKSFGLEAALIRGPFHATGEVHWLEADGPTADPSPAFFGGYAEVGLYLTGESRGYKAGRWDRTKVLKPVGGGGAGAFQINLRYDHLDLGSDGITGGRQRGYEASLVWIARDQIRFLLNYGRLRYSDAALPAAGGDRDYSIDVLGARAQVDF